MVPARLSQEVEKAVVWTDPNLQRFHAQSTFVFPPLVCLGIILYSPSELSPSKFTGFLLVYFVWLGTGLVLNRLSSIFSKRTVANVVRKIEQGKIKRIRVKVRPQSTFWRWHSEKMKGPGIRKAIDDRGQVFNVNYRDHLDSEFEADLIKLSWRDKPFPFIQRYVVVPVIS